MKRLGRDAAERTALASHLAAHGLVLKRSPAPSRHGPAESFLSWPCRPQRLPLRDERLYGMQPNRPRRVRGCGTGPPGW